MRGHVDGGDSPRACHLVCQPSRNRADPGDLSLLKTEAESFFCFFNQLDLNVVVQ